MIPTNRTYAPVEVFVDELARCGMRFAVTCPGSRNAPIALALAAEARIRSFSILDERSAAFFALGIAKRTGLPVALTCTSGTAAANFHPAVVEAWEARVPLVVLTADRPPELREVGAGQAIDQFKLYGSSAKWFCEVGTHEPRRETAVHLRALACRAWASAAGGRPGPVHLNFPLREPLAPVREQLDPEVWAGREDGRPWVELLEPRRPPDDALVARLADAVAQAPRGALVCGPGGGRDVPAAAARLAAAVGWPMLAEPTSGARCGSHDRSHVVAHYDALLRASSWASARDAALVVRTGDTPTSKPLRGWLARAQRQVVLDPHGAWHEPTRSADTLVAADAALTLRAVADALTAQPPAADDGWLDGWCAADAQVAPALAAVTDPFEPKVHAAAVEAIGDAGLVWVSSSMPIRDVETFLPSSPASLELLANRGANGIDGVVSSALGAAAAAPGPALLLIGELALLHDLGGLVAAQRLGIELTIVCCNNGGGGIFDFLPVAAHADPARYEEHVATPMPVDLAAVAAAFGFPHRRASTPAEVREAVAAGHGIVEVRTERPVNRARHGDALAAVVARIDEPV